MNTTHIVVAGKILEAAISVAGCRVWPPSLAPVVEQAARKRWSDIVGGTSCKQIARTPVKRKPGPRLHAYRRTVSEAVLEYYERVTDYVRAHPGKQLSEIVAAVECPYTAVNTARDSLTRAIKKNLIAVKLEKDGKRARIYPA